MVVNSVAEGGDQQRGAQAVEEPGEVVVRSVHRQAERVLPREGVERRADVRVAELDHCEAVPPSGALSGLMPQSLQMSGAKMPSRTRKSTMIAQTTATLSAAKALPRDTGRRLADDLLA